MPAAKPSRPRSDLRLEPLEARHTPATLVSPTTVTYQDADGDDVRVVLSKPLLTPATVNTAFTFDTGALDGDNTVKQQLRAIDLGNWRDLTTRVSVTVTATPSPTNGGDGRAAVGWLNAGGADLGRVTIDGDLGQLDGGDFDPPRLRGLAVHSLGQFGLATGAAQQAVTVRGPVGFIRVETDVTGVAIQVFGDPGGRIGSVVVGGSLIGGAGDQSGSLVAEGHLGPVTIGGNLIGGPGNESGRVFSGGRLAGVTVGGSVGGAAGDRSGEIFAARALGPVRVGGDLVGGSGWGSGSVASDAGLAGVTVGGSVRGGTQFDAGSIRSDGNIGPVVIRGDLVGNEFDLDWESETTGFVRAFGRLAAVTVGGSVRGGADGSGLITAFGGIGPIVIRGDVVGGTGWGAGSVFSEGRVARVTVGGSVSGGTEWFSGTIGGSAGSGPVVIGGDVTGGTGEGGSVSGSRVTVGGSVVGGAGGGGQVSGKAVTVGGDVIGGAGGDSARVFAGRLGATVGGSVVGGAGDSSGSISGPGPVRIGGDLVGGTGYVAGAVASDGPIARVTVGGSVRGGVITGEDIGPVVIGGDLVGTGDNQSGSVWAFGRLAAVTVGGSVVGGSASESGQITAETGMGPVAIRGDLVGGAGPLSGTVYCLFGPVARVTVGGSVVGGTSWGSGSVIVGPVGAVHIGGNLVGGSASGTADLSWSGSIDAFRIGRLTIGGSLVAGTDDTTGTFQSNGAVRVLDDVGSVLIRGSVLGNPTNPATITAGGWLTPADVDIGRLTVLGRVEHALIQAGLYLGNWWTLNPDAQIGPVFVGGDWIASSLAAGADPGASGFFGDADDTKMLWEEDDPRVSSRIASWTVAGQVSGTLGGTDHYGIVAEVVGVVTVGGTVLPTTPGKSNDDFAVGITGDFRVNEV